MFSRICLIYSASLRSLSPVLWLCLMLSLIRRHLNSSFQSLSFSIQMSIRHLCLGWIPLWVQRQTISNSSDKTISPNQQAQHGHSNSLILNNNHKICHSMTLLQFKPKWIKTHLLSLTKYKILLPRNRLLMFLKLQSLKTTSSLLLLDWMLHKCNHRLHSKLQRKKTILFCDELDTLLIFLD